MDWVVNRWDSLQQKIQASRASSSAASSRDFPFERPEQINDHVYQVHKPEGRPSIEVVFFHGLQFEGSKEAYLTTWLSAEGNELWLKWILKDFPNARILLVSYDACAQRNNEDGRMDMYLTCENLVACLTEGKAKVGGDDCPVILVGHSIGGLVIKELCVKLHSTVSKVLPHSPKEPVQNLLQNIRGLFYYACPHLGSRLADTSSDFPKGPLFEGITTLNNEAQRRNEEFRELHRKYGWKTYGIVERRPTTLGWYEDFIVTEASARYDVDDFYSYAGDHFDTCRPQSRTSSNFSLLLDFLATVLEEVQDKRSPKMSIPNGVHGLEGRVKAVMDMLKQGARRLGLVGMGGIGKTTLATAVYDTISASFEYTCFMRDVKKSMAKKDNLEYLQNKIIKTLLDRRGCKVKKHFDWTKLKGKKVLIVLDDVECESQVQVMLESDGFSNESCVIVTSRESRFLYAESFQCYFVEALDQEDSKRIFCLNAFHKEVPRPGYELRVANFTKRCGGLPLALRVAGKYLYAQKEDVWDEGLEKLKQAVSLDGSKEDKLSSLLKECYESLAEIEQEMFLDVATCFHNQDVETLYRAWSVCGWALPKSGLGNLVDKGFVTIEDTITIEEDSTPREGRIVRMHEVLRDLGRSIACPKTENVGTHTRLCYDLSNPRSTTELFNEGKAQVKVLIVHRCEDISVQSLHGLEELRILWLEDVNLHGPFNFLPPNLKYMKISDSRLSIQPEGSRSRSAEASDERGKKRKRLRQHSALKQLDIHACKLLDGSLDSLGQCQALEGLEINSLLNWTAIPKSLGKLRALKDLRVASCNELESIRPLRYLLALKYLVIQDCRKIKAIPKSLGRLEALEHLVVSCGCFKAPGQALRQLRALRHFECTCCRDWEGLINWLGRLEALTKIVIHSCVDHSCSFIGQIQLQEFFRKRSLLQGIVQVELPMLEKDSFKIIAWPSTLLLREFGTLGRARMLLIKDCLSLKSLPNILGNFQILEDLKIVNCGLEALPDTIGELQALRRLSIISCNSMKSLPGTIRDLQDLRYLLISCGTWKAPPNNLQQVKGLRFEMTWCRLRGWKALLDTLAQLHSLQTLVIHDCIDHGSPSTNDQLQFLESLSKRGLLQGVGQVELPVFHEEHVEIVACNSEQFPSDFHRLGHASSLLLKDCRNLKVLPDTLGEFRALRKIEIKSCRDLKSFPDALGKLEALEHLRIEDCSTLEALPGSLGKLEALKELTIEDCNRVEALPDTIGELQALRSLSIISCRSLKSLPGTIRHLQDLRYLLISCGTWKAPPNNLQQVKGLRFEMTWCRLRGWKALLDTLAQLHSLQTLVIHDCIDHGSPSTNDQLQFLESLSKRGLLQGVGQVELPVFHEEHVEIVACNSEQFPSDFHRLGHASSLLLKDCRNLKVLPDTLGEFRALRKIEIKSCRDLKSFPDALGKLEALEHLRIEDCSTLEALPGSLGKLEALKELTIEDCNRVEALPDTIGELQALRSLSIISCRSLKSLPGTIRHLQDLRYLLISCGTWKAPPNNLQQVKGLRFEMTWCRLRGWKALLDTLAQLHSLQTLVIHDCIDHGSPSTNDQLQFLESLSKRGLLQGVGQVELPVFHEEHVEIVACNSEQFPSDFHRLGHASSLLLKDCRNLKVLPDTLGEFRALRKIEIKSCRDLKLFPDALGKLEALEHLRIEDCSTLEALPGSLGKLEALKELTIEDCNRVEALPDTIGELQALRSLSIISCRSLKSLPGTIRHLQDLRYLLISCGKSKAPPNNLQQVEGLRLEMSWCQLRDWKAPDWKALLDTLGQLHSPQPFVIHDCINHGSPGTAEWLQRFQLLEPLSRSGLQQFVEQVDPPVFHEKRVEIICCNLEQFPSHFHRLGHASSLLLKDCRNLKVLPDTLGEFHALRKFEIKSCRHLNSLPDDLGKLEALKELNIEDCYSLKALPDSLGKLGALERLVIKSCRHLNSLPDDLGKLEALKELNIEDCNSLKALPDSLGKLGALERFVIKSCGQLNSLPDDLGKLEALKELNIEDCYSLKALPDSLGKLGTLERFVIKSCWYLNSLPDDLGKLEVLKELNIEDCNSLKALPDSLGKLGAVERFVIKSCWYLNSFPMTLGNWKR